MTKQHPDVRPSRLHLAEELHSHNNPVLLSKLLDPSAFSPSLTQDTTALFFAVSSLKSTD